ncbi:hypothetical protein SPHV1_2350066 [Novosphingobium sp. KN65.2]|nr:hypothetical protein SPHV1_2350066 [Novosphingobium sp. KN65.2]
MENSIANGFDALSGPVLQGDTETIRRHLAELASDCPESLPTYRTMAFATNARQKSGRNDESRTAVAAALAATTLRLLIPVAGLGASRGLGCVAGPIRTTRHPRPIELEGPADLHFEPRDYSPATAAMAAERGKQPGTPFAHAQPSPMRSLRPCWCASPGLDSAWARCPATDPLTGARASLEEPAALQTRRSRSAWLTE